MKKKIMTWLAVMLALTMLLGSTLPVFAYQTRSGKFSVNYSLGAEDSTNIYNVAMAQKGRTKAQMGYSEAWCADFVLDCARLAGISTDVIPYTNKSAGSCRSFYNLLMNNLGAQKISNPQRGDLVFYYCSSCKAYAHVGIYAGSGYRIEGNVDGKVLYYNTTYKDSRSHSCQQIYVRPRYQTKFSACNVSLSGAYFSYTGGTIKPGVTVKYGSRILRNGTDYVVGYQNNVKTGQGTVIVTGRGTYKGTKSCNFYITPRNTSVSMSAGLRRLTVMVKVSGEVNGYELQYKKNSSLTWSQALLVTQSQSVSITQKGLTSLTKYNARIRAYRTTLNGTRVYGAWSSVMTKNVF